MKKKMRSKKGLTLVELVVTVAILGIVSSMGVGIVANSITNYSKASVTSQEQQTALDIENFIRLSARKADGAELLTAAAGTMTIPQPGVSCCYIYFDNGLLRTMSSTIEDATSDPVVIKDSYKGVHDISFHLRKQKMERDDTTSRNRFVYLDYTINMERGYSLKGSTVMGNIAPDYHVTNMDNESFIDYDEIVVLVRSGGAAYAMSQEIVEIK